MKEGVRGTSPVSAPEEPIVFVIDDDPAICTGREEKREIAL